MLWLFEPCTRQCGLRVRTLSVRALLHRVVKRFGFCRSRHSISEVRCMPQLLPGREPLRFDEAKRCLVPGSEYYRGLGVGCAVGIRR